MIRATIKAVRRALAVFASFGLALATAAAAGATTPTTLVRAPQAITAYVHDGDRIGWASCNHLWLRRLSTGATVRSRWRCANDLEQISPPALAGRRLLWSEEDLTKGEERVGGEVFTMLAGGRRSLIDRYDASVRVGAAGDATTLIYSRVAYGCTGTPCVSTPRGGVRRVIDGSTRQVIPGAPPARALAAASGRIALLKAPAYGPAGEPLESPSIEIRAAKSGALLSTVVPSGGNVSRFALSESVLAVFVELGTRMEVQRYAVPSGDFLGSTPTGWVTHLDVSGDRIVYQSGGKTGSGIGLIDAPSGRKRILVHTRGQAAHVSIEGRRLTWVRTRFDLNRSRIMSLLLPRT